MNNSKNVIVNFIWRFAERVGAQLVAFVVSIVLARLLSPDDYGTIALVTVFTSLLNVFVDSGLGTALIQKKDADDLDFSTVFYTNMAMCSLLYALMFALAPFIAEFYGRTDLVPVIRVLSLTLVISGLKNVQQAYVSRNMIFKRFFFATLGGTIGAAIIGISMAYMGLGVWALVAQQLFNATVDTLILWITVKWRPKKLFSFDRLKGLFGYGWKLLASAILETGYNELSQLIIGKKYSTSDLAYYNQGDKFPKLVVNNINSSVNSVLLPTLSKEQDDKERVKNMTRRAIKTSVFIMAPLMMGLAATSREVVLLLLTEKWLPCVPFLCVFCVSYMFWPIHTVNLNAIKAMGRSDLFLRLEIIKKVVGIIIILITMNISVWAMCVGLMIEGFISQAINSWPNKELLDYGYIEQMKDILPGIILAVVMAGIVYLVGWVNVPVIARLVLQVIVGALVYITGAKLFKMESYTYIMGMVMPYLKKIRR